MNKAKLTRVAIILCAIVTCSSFAACSNSGQSADPGAWGYDCKVTYDSLGGMVNAREVRNTYYLPNSYLFEPSGSSNMLVQPTRDGYILAGWYKAKTDTPTALGEEYTFSAGDRWDFFLDRVQGDMTLYARWLPQGRVDYVDAGTGDSIFGKNITADSPVQELSEAVVEFRKPEGTTLFGYYSDQECTKEYDFASYVHSEPQPTQQQLYDALYEQFPQYLEKVEYVEPDKDQEIDATTDTSWLFLNKIGYQLKTTDEQALAELRAAKDQLVETYIENYLTNTAGKVVYMKFVQGNFIRVNQPGDLKIGGKYGFFGTDEDGNKIDGYVIESDIDFSGVSFTMADNFSGVIYGNNHTLSNLTLSLSSRKVDKDTEKSIALFNELSDTTIDNLTFENAAISIQVDKGVAVKAALLALSAKNVTLTNVKIQGLTIDSGKGDTAGSRYTLGDLYLSASGTKLNDCVGEGLVANISESASLRLSLLKLEAAEPTPAP